MTTANVSCYITEHTAASSAHKPTTTIICLLGELLKKCDAVWRVAVHKARTPPAACPPQSPRPFPALQANTALLAHLRRQRANRGRHADDTRQPHLLSAAQVESHLQVPLCKLERDFKYCRSCAEGRPRLVRSRDLACLVELARTLGGIL